MKTRIVYPQLWLDVKFAECNPTTKLLFMYLITNDKLGLSRFSRISDRQIMFDTGLNSNQLETGKKELNNLKWVFFVDNEWIYHNHNCAYVDYSGRDRVIASKNTEIINIPSNIKEVFKGLITGFKPVLNHKSKTINHKSKTINQKPKENFSKIEDLEKNGLVKEIAEKYHVSDSFVLSKIDDLQNYCESKGKRYRNYKAALMDWVKRDATKLIKEANEKSKIGIARI